MPAARIEDHAIVGDGRSCALVARDGTMDWLCLPRFDSPAVLAGLLDSARGGTWRIAPTIAHRSTRSYVSRTNVLVTRFRNADGAASLVDVFPVHEAHDQKLAPDHEVLRIVTCERGAMPFAAVCDLRPDFGRDRARRRDARALGIRVEPRDGGVYALRGDVPSTLDDAGIARASFTLRAGQSAAFTLTYAREAPGTMPLLGAHAQERVEHAVRWWRQWLRPLAYDGPYGAHVTRSALALKLLGYAPSGAVVAAATTSLPERVGGDLNWDYRYCWLRDASLTTRALFGLGFRAEAEAFVGWLLHSTALTRPRLRPMYDVFGNRVPRERVIAHLDGHRGSRPVRVGNGARGQLQLDVYGEVIDAAAQFVLHGGSLDRDTAEMLVGFGREVCRDWRRPDEGIWEPRASRERHTHSLVTCWTALDRLIALGREGRLHGVPLALFERERESIRELVETRAFCAEVGSYTRSVEVREPDAALLLLPWYGFAKADSARMRGTFRWIERELGAGRGLYYRYPESRGIEGAFGICGFWAVEHLALGGGTLARACEAFEELVGVANDVGLLSEEVDPVTGDALGNFPQAFSHVGLVSAALAIRERARGMERPRTPRRLRRRPLAHPEMRA